MALTDRQQRFVEEYLVDLNATAAYKRAGYTCKNDNAAAASASALLRNPKIASAIAAAQAARSHATGITAAQVLVELANLARSDIGEILDFTGTEPRLRPVNQIPERARRAIASVKVKRYFEGFGDDAREVEVTEFKLWDKLGAITKAMQHLGMLVEKHEHSGPGGGPIQHTHDLSDSELDTRIAELESRVPGAARRTGSPSGS